MICPQCGQENQELTRFCRKCGVNLEQLLSPIGRAPSSNIPQATGQVSRESLARTLLERVQREVRRPGHSSLFGMIFGDDQTHQVGKMIAAFNELLESPEEKRLRRTRAGIVTAAVGSGVSLFLYIFFQALGRFVGPPAEELLTSLWAVGLIPLLIGLGLALNGLLFTKTRKASAEFEARRADMDEIGQLRDQMLAGSAMNPDRSSVTEHTTSRLDLPESNSRK